MTPSPRPLNFRSTYLRSTTVADLSELPTEMRFALRDHADSHQIRIDEQMPAWITRSVNPPATSLVGRLLKRRSNPTDPDAEHQTVVVVHPVFLLLVIAGAVRGVTVRSIALAQASIATDSSGDGFSVTGFPGDLGQSGSIFVGLGPEQAGADCLAAVQNAVSTAKNS